MIDFLTTSGPDPFKGADLDEKTKAVLRILFQNQVEMATKINDLIAEVNNISNNMIYMVGNFK